MSEFIYSEWYRPGGGLSVRRAALPLSHPESVVQLWIKQFGNLDGFPWVKVYGSEPSAGELVRAGLATCPTCGCYLHERNR